MKKILLYVMLSCTPTLFSQTWISQDSDVSENLNDVYCISASEVVVVGNSGTILKTYDGGDNWIIKSSGSNEDLKKVQFVNATTGFTFGENGTLLKTNDAAESWVALETESSEPIYDLSCVDENVFFITSGATLKKTVDGGSSFATVNTNQPGRKIQFLNSQTGFAANNTTLFKTVDGGITWTVIKEDYFVYSFFFLNENSGFVYTDNGSYKTIDGGLTLTGIGYSYSQAQDLFSFDGNTVWEVNALLLLCGCPPDYCISKRNISENNESEAISNCGLSGNPDFTLSAIHFANPTTGFAVGAMGYQNPMNQTGPRGAIYKNSTGEMEVQSIDEAKKENVKVFPNPASNELNISFTENPSQHFSIEILDHLGKRIALKNDVARLDLSKYSAGIYVAKIISETGIEIRKFIKK